VFVRNKLYSPPENTSAKSTNCILRINSKKESLPTNLYSLMIYYSPESAGAKSASCAVALAQEGRLRYKRPLGLSLTQEQRYTLLILGHGEHYGPPERGEHRPFEWGRRVCGGLSSALGVARCGRSAGCVLCVL